MLQKERFIQEHDVVFSFGCSFQESAKYMSSEQISHVPNTTIRDRIAVRLIAEQHIVLSRALQNTEQANATDVGIVDKALSIYRPLR
jgi:26S proteasome regulatory subunit T1